MAIQLELGLEVIQSYKRLSYTPWHAMAEFIDNSTQSYFNNKAMLDATYKSNNDKLEVSIVYDKDTSLLRIVDNAMGMSYDELKYALRVGARPQNQDGRCKYGMGLKTSACWLGNSWSVKTKKLGEHYEYCIKVDVNEVSTGNNLLPEQSIEVDPKEHYTIVEITGLNRSFPGRTQGKIKDFLGSMYRHDLSRQELSLLWNGSPLSWLDSDDDFLKAHNGSIYKKNFNFVIDGKNVSGWVGILSKGSRARAGFSILHADRVVKGWPDSWRPESIYGQIQGSNDLVNQRVVGEIALDCFEVSHTKDDILWQGDEEQKVQELLKTNCGDYREVAKTHRKGGDDQRRPSEIEVATAVDEFKRELSSSEIVDAINIETVPPPEAVRQALLPLQEATKNRQPTFEAKSGELTISGYLIEDASTNDPYLRVDSTCDDNVQVIINTQHPHWSQLVGSEGVLNYLRHCTYDGIAEWQARRKASNLAPDTIKILKDRLLRTPLLMEMHDN